MILSAQLLDTLDRCPRRYAFEREYESRTISPLGLLYAAVEGSLVSSDPVQGAKDAIAERTSRLDVIAGNLSPLSSVRHVEAMAEVMALALRAKFGRASRADPVPIGDHEWHSNLFVLRGQLHRIVLVSHLDDDTLRSFAHSWGTVGELAALERPLFLTVVIVGAQRGGRRHSPWAKGYLHPVQRVLRFGRRKGSKADGFTEGWKEVWREQTEISAETWLERMNVDAVMDELIVSRRIQFNGDDERMKQAKRDIFTLAESAGAACTSSPMRRSSCDDVVRGACPWQTVCYSSTPVTPDDLPGLYRRRGTPLAGPE